MNHTAQDILNKIKKENIKPVSRFYFVLKHSVLWIPYIIVTIIGIFAFAGVLFAATHSGWEYREFLYPSTASFIFATLPFVWIIGFIFFSIFVVKALRSTHTGYRLSLRTILFGSMATSVILGYVLYEMDDFFKADSLIRYPVHQRERAMWNAPKEGRLVGFIEEVGKDSLIVRDMNGAIWNIDMRSLGTTTFPFVTTGSPVRFIGSSTNEYVFAACMVFPWEIGGMKRPENRPFPPKEAMLKAVAPSPECKEILDEIKKFRPRPLRFN